MCTPLTVCAGAYYTEVDSTDRTDRVCAKRVNQPGLIIGPVAGFVVLAIGVYCAWRLWQKHQDEKESKKS